MNEKLRKTLVGFAASLGLQINEDAISEIDGEVTVNKYDMAKPDNWSDMSEEDQKMWEEKHMVKNVSDPEPDPKPALQPAKKPVAPATPAPLGENVVWLNSLIDEIGGQDAFKALLFGAVQAVEVMQNNEETERKDILTQLVTNSGGMLTEEELKDFELPVLRKMAKAMLPMQVNFAPMGGRTNVHANKAEDVAAMPDIFDPNFWTKEA